jgi:hypothetical protein
MAQLNGSAALRPQTWEGIPVILAGLVLVTGCGSGSRSGSQEPRSPIAVSIVPASGSGPRQAFTTSYTHADGVAHIATARLLFNHYADGRTACYVYYDRASTSFLLVNDSGEGTTRLARGNAEHLENGQCVLDGSASSVIESGNQLTMTVSIAFKQPFSGQMNAYLFSDDTSGNSTGFQQRGTWEVP